jgi:hypothetical protein
VKSWWKVSRSSGVGGRTRGRDGAPAAAAHSSKQGRYCLGKTHALAPSTSLEHPDLAVGKPHGRQRFFGIVRRSAAGQGFCYTQPIDGLQGASCGRLHGHWLAVPALELGGREVSDRGVSSLLVLKDLDVIDGSLLRLAVALEMLTELGLERREPALRRSVVVAVAAVALCCT